MWICYSVRRFQMLQERLETQRTSALTTSHKNLSMTQRNRTSVMKLKAATQSLLGPDAIASLTMASRPED